MKPSSKRTVRIVFGAAVLWIAVLQYVLFAIGRAEPYPALVLPGFPARCAGCLLETGVPREQEPALFVRFADGHMQQVPREMILPPGPSVRLIAFSTAFKDGAVASNPDAVAWMRERISQRFPHQAVLGLDIVWREATYHGPGASSVEYTPLNTVRVDFGTPQ